MVPPSELIFGRNFRDNIPPTNDLVLEDGNEETRDNDLIQKQKGKEREDKNRDTKSCNIVPGDKVCIQNMIIPNKLCTTFGSDEYEVIDRKGNEVILLKEGKIFRRQASH